MRDASMPSSLPRDASYFAHHLRALALQMREAVGSGIRGATIEELSASTGDRGGDTIYRLDEHGESTLLTYCAEWGRDLPFLLVSEGLEGGGQVFPAHADPGRLAFTMIVDPIDGTRGLMY